MTPKLELGSSIFIHTKKTIFWLQVGAARFIW
jgi:hypothetical protein